MGPRKKQDLRSSSPVSTGFVRATPPRAAQAPLRAKAIKAYRKQAELNPARLGPIPGLSETVDIQSITSPEEVNLEDLLDSDRKAA